MGGRAGSSHRGGEIDRGFLSNTKKTLKEIREIAEIRLTVLSRCVLDTAHGEFSLKLVDVSQINPVCGIAEGLGGTCFFGSNISCVWFLQISRIV